MTESKNAIRRKNVIEDGKKLLEKKRASFGKKKATPKSTKEDANEKLIKELKNGTNTISE